MNKGPSRGGVFVTGTDTGIGKTVAAACLVRALDGDYWKPVQTGPQDAADTPEIGRLTGLAPDRLHPPTHHFRAPLSPHEAAALDGGRIELADFHLPTTPRRLVVEGAGGLLVPLNEIHLMIDLMEHLGLPVVVVASGRLGTINHSLLTLGALGRRKLAVAGMILMGPTNPANRQAIQHFSGLANMAEIPYIEDLDEQTLPRLPESFVKEVSQAMSEVAPRSEVTR